MWKIDGEKFEFTESIVIDATPSEVYKVVSSFDRYADFLSDIERAEYLEDGRCSMVVRAGPLRVEVITEVEYLDNQRVDFLMVEGPPIEGASGSWILKPIETSGTEVTFQASLKSGKSGKWLLKTASKYVERKGMALIEAFKSQIEMTRD